MTRKRDPKKRLGIATRESDSEQRLGIALARGGEPGGGRDGGGAGRAEGEECKEFQN